MSTLLVAATAAAKESEDAAKRDQAQQLRFGLFGSIEFRTNNLNKLTQWRNVVERAREEESVYAACELRGVQCSQRVVAWREKLRELQGMSGREQLRALNKFINLHSKHREDLENFNRTDYWTTPREFLNRDGDCEDFAIIKYFSLLELGYSDDQLRLVVIRDRQRNVAHAVVTVTIDDRSFVLDSLFNEPVPHQYVLHYEPVYSVNLSHRWAHIVTPQIRNKFLDHIAGLRLSQK